MTNIKKLTCQFASLNACSLIKTASRQTQSDYIRYLRLLQHDIICFQETHAKTPELIDSLNIHFQPQDAIWNKHLGIVSFSSSFQLSLLDTSSYYESDRFQLCKVEHPQSFYTPFYILNIYATANSNPDRRKFFDHLTSMLYAMNEQLSLDRLIIAGDFNYSILRTQTLSSSTSTEWLNFIDLYFYNSMITNDLEEVPTFQRSHGETVINSVIDYIYVGLALRHQITEATIAKLLPSWSDHSVLKINLIVGKSPTGPGLWRGNPLYASHKALIEQITVKVRKVLRYCSSQQPPIPEAEQWDKIKIATKKTIREYSYEYVDWRKKTIRHLERKRNRILRGKPVPALRVSLITPIDRQLGILQQELTDIAALKAGLRWRENGEKSAGFLKRIYQTRTIQQHMTAVRQTVNITVETEPPTDSQITDPVAMSNVVSQYYQQLYTNDPVSPTEIDGYLQPINFDRKVSHDDNEGLIAPIPFDEIFEQAKRSPVHSSPGEDGLGYQYVKILFRIVELQPLILKVYNQALIDGIIPDSWKDIRVRLLPKKGDLTNLKNWRPISLINCDAKIFTRIINLRLAEITNRIIQPAQTGFMRGRFIGDNGLLLHLVIQQARQYKYSGVGLLLDQEKAYDRVNPDYLVKVLSSFGFHSTFIRCIRQLFFSNQVQINVNGFMSPTVNQERGLRQGDPLSPILFNLALEPLLLSILQDTSIIGYRTGDSSRTQCCI